MPPHVPTIMKRFYLFFVAFCTTVSHVDARAPDVARSPQGFQLALPGKTFSFPRDHGAHPNFATEWWYYTGHLRDKNGRRFGYQLTWFRQALTPQLKGRTSKWATRDIVFAHFAITDESGQKFHFSDKIARGAAGVAGSSTRIENHRAVWIGDWDLRFDARGRQTVHARGTSQNNSLMALSLDLSPTKPPVINGQNGVSQKSEGLGQASHYYSMTRLESRGTLKLGSETFAVEGNSWLDREWGSNQLGRNQIGWDWFALQLDDGRELMLYRMRLRGGGTDKFSSGTLIERNGRSRHLTVQDFSLQPTSTWRSPHTKALYPSTWRVRVPSAKLDMTIVPTLRDQELRTNRSTGIAYWEGSNRVLDVRTNRQIGRAYVELTGYDKPFSNFLR